MSAKCYFCNAHYVKRKGHYCKACRLFLAWIKATLGAEIERD